MATEIAQRLLQFGFEEMRAHRIFAICRPANTASWRVLEKIGMRREGHLRQHRWMKESWSDSIHQVIPEATHTSLAFNPEHVHMASASILQLVEAVRAGRPLASK